MTPRCPLIVMAKAPVAGLAKTRLIPALGAAGAVALAERLLRHAVGEAGAAARSGHIGSVDLCCTPDTSHPAFALAAACPGVSLSLQGAGDLGQRMQAAFSRWLPAAQGALMMGTDIPGLVCGVLQQAALALQTADAVIVPALDGGYALIGLRHPAPTLFADMPWSTPAVLAITRRRLAAAGLRHAELQPLADIDEPADLPHLPAGWLGVHGLQ
jgi:uncharacterized protein